MSRYFVCARFSEGLLKARNGLILSLSDAFHITALDSRYSEELGNVVSFCFLEIMRLFDVYSSSQAFTLNAH